MKAQGRARVCALRIAVAMAIAAAWMVLAAPAQAGDLVDMGGTLTYQADPGESNTLSAWKSGGFIVVADAGAGLGGIDMFVGCVRPNGVSVQCPDTGYTVFNAELGDMDDVYNDALGITAWIDGGDGDDTLKGGAGPDIFYTSAGADVVQGGSGVDIAQYHNASGSIRVSLDGIADDGEQGENDNVWPDVETVNGSGATDILIGSAGPDTLISGVGGDDELYGGGGSDVLTGGDGDDTLVGGDGDDTITPGNGNDSVDGGSGNDSVMDAAGANVVALGDGDDIAFITSVTPGTYDGGAGADDITGPGSLRGSDGDDTLTGTAGADALDGGAGNDLLQGGDGNDSLRGRDGSDIVDGGAGSDVYYVTSITGARVSLDGIANDGAVGENDNVLASTDDVVGGAGADVLVGSAGVNTLNGGGGNDAIYGGGGADVLNGGDGDDRIDGGFGADQITGGNGRDVALYAQRVTALVVSLDNVANDGAAGEADNVATEDVVGGKGADVIYGSASNNMLVGGPGADQLVGGAGVDALSGGDGADVLRVRDGQKEQVACGEGADRVIADKSDVAAASCETVLKA